MFAHNKRLQYTVRVSELDPGLANLMLEQFGGPQGELAAAMRYFTQAVREDRPGRKNRLFTPKAAVLEKMAMRTMSDPTSDPVSGAKLKLGRKPAS